LANLLKYDTSALTTVTNDEAAGDDVQLYDLQGRHLTAPANGIFIQDGKLRMMR